MWQVIADITGPDCDASVNGSIELNVSGATGPYTYAWAGPNNFTSELFNPSELDTGAYAVVITDENDCIFNQGYGLVSQNDFSFSLGDDTVLCVYNSTVVSGPPGYSYEWQDGSINQFFEIVGEECGIGQFAVLLTATTDEGCAYTDAFQFTVDACLGVEAMRDSEMIIFPNPINNSLNVRLDRFANDVFAELIDATGRIVEQKHFQAGQQFLWNVNLPSGVYTFRLTTDQGIYARQVVKN
jgi:hypothetical protein